MKQSLTAIVPFFNEEKTLYESVNQLALIEDIEMIILVDDCSSDNSLNIAKQLEIEFKDLKIFLILKNETNSGKGSAINNAKNFISTSHVLIHDADLEYFPIDIPPMYKLSIDNPESLILGSRFIGNKTRNNLYFRTYLANKVMSMFFSFVNFYRVTDVATCYKLFPSSFLKEINIQEKGFSIEIELLSKFLKKNKSIKEYPISYDGRSYKDGKKIKLIDGILYLINTIKYRFFN
tara:strand:+ start:2114 stop:2818 length:705 start_codon:yes stop_codon:yes gene_type:complete